GSDRLIDALIVWGDEKTIRSRLDAHVQAGADHVCVQTIGGMKGGLALPDETLLALLAPGAGYCPLSRSRNATVVRAAEPRSTDPSCRRFKSDPRNHGRRGASGRKSR